jgi:hypothetical protein
MHSEWNLGGHGALLAAALCVAGLAAVPSPASAEDEPNETEAKRAPPGIHGGPDWRNGRASSSAAPTDRRRRTGRSHRVSTPPSNPPRAGSLLSHR